MSSTPKTNEIMSLVYEGAATMDIDEEERLLEAARKKIAALEREAQARFREAEGRFDDGVIAALGALCGMETPDSVHYHEVARTFDTDALMARARKTGSVGWCGIGKYIRYQRKQEAWRELSREGN